MPTPKMQNYIPFPNTFEQWYKTVPYSKNDTSSYDLRGAYEELKLSENGRTQLRRFASTDDHLGDRYKLPTHPTFSTESKYSNSKTPGGEWNENKDGTWTFKPSWVNIKSMGGEDKFLKWMKENEPEVIIDLKKSNPNSYIPNPVK